MNGKTADIRLSLVLEHMPQGLMFIDRNGSVALFNRAAQKILELDEDNILNRKFDDIFPNRALGFSFEEAASGSELPHSKEISLLSSSRPPKEIILEIEPKAVYDESQDQIEGVIVLARDVTDARQQERIADRKSRLEDLAELASTIGHEIRNPLGGIKGFASLLQSDLRDDPQKLRMVDNLIQGVDDVNRTLTELIDYTRPQALELTKSDVKELITNVIESMQDDEYVADRVKISFQSPRGPVVTAIDAARLRAALANLILNAAQAIEDQGCITISLTETEINIRIEIEDTGSGIEEKNLKKIFRPFFSTRGGGSGFGLAEAEKIIDAHSGEIKVSSEEEKGSKFILTLPRLHED